MSDDSVRRLLQLLYQYLEDYDPDLPQTIPALAEDLSMSLDRTSDEDDRMSREIQERWTP